MVDYGSEPFLWMERKLTGNTAGLTYLLITSFSFATLSLEINILNRRGIAVGQLAYHRMMFAWILTQGILTAQKK